MYHFCGCWSLCIRDVFEESWGRTWCTASKKWLLWLVGGFRYSLSYFWPKAHVLQTCLRPHLWPGQFVKLGLHQQTVDGWPRKMDGDNWCTTPKAKLPKESGKYSPNLLGHVSDLQSPKIDQYFSQLFCSGFAVWIGVQWGHLAGSSSNPATFKDVSRRLMLDVA